MTLKSPNFCQTTVHCRATISYKLYEYPIKMLLLTPLELKLVNYSSHNQYFTVVMNHVFDCFEEKWLKIEF